VLLPAVRRTPPDRFVIADGFSCRQQIRDGTGCWAMHPAEVIALALQSRGAVPEIVPERRYLERPARAGGTAAIAGAGLAGAGIGLAIALIARGAHRSPHRGHAEC